MNFVYGFTTVVSKILEIIMWIALVLVIVSLIASCIGIGYLNKYLRENKIDTEELLSKASEIVSKEDKELAGFITQENYDLILKILKDEGILNQDGTIKESIVIISLLDGILQCLTFALIFRNINLILKTAKGKTRFSEGETPFQPNITRMIREIGIFLLSLSGAQLILSMFSLSPVSFNLTYIVFGFLMLCLSSFFNYGERLQKNADTPNNNGEIEYMNKN